jgi:hypothetical protein
LWVPDISGTHRHQEFNVSASSLSVLARMFSPFLAHPMTALIKGKDVTVLREPLRCTVPFVCAPSKNVQQEDR